MTGIAAGPRQKQLLIGVDAMEWTLTERWAAQGKLPTLRRLIEQGTRATLASTATELPDTVWPTICTGTRPGRYGNYFYVQYDPRTQGLRHAREDEISSPAFWDYLSEAGVSVGVADVPHFRLSQSPNGYHLANWGAHASRSGCAARPASLRDEVASLFGRYVAADCDAVNATPGGLRRLRRDLVEGTRQHGRLFRWLMREHPCEMF